MTYTTTGPVRGTCGHKHRSIQTAVRCIEKDQRECRSVGGYSDRSVRRTDGEDLTWEESDEIMFGDNGPVLP